MSGSHFGERRLLSPIFGERWPLAYFDLPGRCFGFLSSSKVRIGAERSQLVEGRHIANS